MTLIPIKFATFDTVIIKDNTPHCIHHGAMNKVNSFDNGGGYWRCISAIHNHNDTACRTGCCVNPETTK